MGQINCHCHYTTCDDYEAFKRHSQVIPVLSTQQTQPTQIHTKMVLRNGCTSIDIPLSQSSKSTFGTTQDCEKTVERFNGNNFKFQVRYHNRCAYVKDCGVGLGVFLMKRKLVWRAGGSELFLNIANKWVILKILASEQVRYCLYEGQRANQGLILQGEEHQIDLGGDKLMLKQQGRQFTIRKSDRGQMWVLLGEERRVKPKDVLRLGFQSFHVESVSSYLESSTILQRY